MKMEIKFTGEMKKLNELLDTFRYKYSDNDFDLVVDCQITMTQIEKEKQVINPVEFSPVDSM